MGSRFDGVMGAIQSSCPVRARMAGTEKAKIAALIAPMTRDLRFHQRSLFVVAATATATAARNGTAAT